MSGSVEMTSLLDRGFDILEEKVRESVDKFNAAVSHISEWEFMLGPIMLAIKPAVDFIRGELIKLVNLAETAVKHHVPVVSLIVQSFGWTEKVQGPVNGLVHTKGHLSYYWEGQASSAYQDKVTAQNNAIGAIATKADQVSKWLMEIAKYNVDYITELAKMATGFAGALVSAAIETASVIDIPFALSDLSGAIGDVVTKSLDNLVGIAKRFVETLSKVRDLKSYMTDQALPRGSWPQAVEG